MTQQSDLHPVPGAIALVGSGEYLDVMNTTDLYLMETLGGVKNARVALLPTASGLEENGPDYWNDLGLRHFKQLDVQDVRPTRIIDRESAADPKQLALLEGANLFYLSGGNPQHTIDTLRGSPAWEIIISAYERGAVLAGCSAGAMTLSAYTIAIRQMFMGEKPGWVTSLGVVPHLVVFPHFDRMANFIDDTTFQELLSTLPTGIIALGVDENTALVRIQAQSTDDPSASGGRPQGLPLQRWQVMGLQTVKVFERGEGPRILHVGEEVLL
jgi:cyanophycinase